MVLSLSRVLSQAFCPGSCRPLFVIAHLARYRASGVGSRVNVAYMEREGGAETSQWGSEAAALMDKMKMHLGMAAITNSYH